MTDSTPPSIQDRLVSAAREHAASTGTPYRLSLDHVAAMNGYRDWNEHERMRADQRLLHRFDYLSAYAFGPSSPLPPVEGKDTRGTIERFAMAMVLPIANALGTLDRMLLASAIMNAFAFVLTMIALGCSIIAMMDYGSTIQMGFASVVASMNLLMAWSWTIRSIAARKHPMHRGASSLLTMPIYWSFWSIPLSAISYFVPMVDTQAQAPDPWIPEIGMIMTMASTLWFPSMVLILHARRSRSDG